MASGVHKATDNRTSKQKNFDFAIEACRSGDERIKSLRERLEAEKLRLAAFSKLVQLHQGDLNTRSTDVFQDRPIRWLGALPDTDVVNALTGQLESDLSKTRSLTGCDVKDCRVLYMEVDNGSILKMYKAALQIKSFKVELSFSSKLQVMTGEEAVHAVTRVAFTPSLPQLEPLQEQVTSSSCLYVVPRALHTLLSLEAQQHEVVVWSHDMPNLEVVSTKLRLVLSYVSLGSSAQQSTALQVPATGRRQTRSSRRSIDSSPTLTEAIHELSSSPESVGQTSEDDGCVTLRWVVAYCKDLRNFRHRFDLDVPQSVLVRYSQNAVLPFLNGSQMLMSPGDVIKLFSAFTH